MKRILKGLWSFLKGLPLAVVMLVVLVLFGFDGWEDLNRGRETRLANEMFSSREDFDEVRIYLLAGDEMISAPTGKFRLGVLGESYDAFGSVSLKGEELSRFTSLWTKQYPIGSSAMCHEPAYGFRLFRNSRAVRETAMCWGCWNFSYPVWPGKMAVTPFDATSEQGIALFEFCTSHLPFEGHEKELQKLRGMR